MPQSMFLLDKHKTIIGIFNAAEETLAGTPIEEVVGNSIMVYANDPDSPFYQACSMLNNTFDSVFHTEVPVKYQFKILETYFEATISKISGERILCQVRDITELTLKLRGVEEQKNSELLMALMAGGLTSWNYDVDSRWITSRHGNNVIGHEMLLDDLLVILEPEYKDMTVGMFDDILQHRSEHAHITIRSKDRDGNMQWIDIHAIPHEYAEDGSVKAIIGSQKEVTKEYEYNEKLRKLITQNELILNNTNAGFVYLTPQLQVEWENVSNIFSDKEITCLFHNGHLCDITCEFAAECSREVVLRALNTNAKASGKFRTSSGIIVESLAQPVTGKNGESEGIVLRMEDITDKEHSIIELAEAKERAEQSDKLKSAFLANMSHEIRTPLNAIVGFAPLISEAENEQDKQDYIDVVNSNSDMLLNLINDILDLSKIEAGYFTCNDAIFDLSALFSELEIIFRHRLSEGVELICDLPRPEFQINLDRVRVAQVITNFMTNAIKFTKQGHIRMGFDLQPGAVRLFVEDTGCGMSEDELRRVFGRFEKFNIFEQGTGLGMPIAKAVVDAYRGQIGAESSVGKGSTFWALLPTGVAAPVEEQTAENALAEEVKKISERDCASVNVLIAEDNDSNYLLIKTLLKGFNLTHAFNGREALELARSRKFDLILMDMRMPEMDGLESTRLIREFDKQIPIIAVTANAFDEDRRQAFEAGVNEFLTKPLRKDLLLKTINQF